MQYSFWRYDAKGWVLVKDWSLENTLDWTPARPGNYSIEIRAKGSDTTSYEVRKNVDVSIADNELSQVQSISINQDELTNVTARNPVVLKASATASNGTDLLYKFYMQDNFLGTSCIQDYSADQHCVWIPRKAGTYKLFVVVKNKVSFGKFDAKSSSFEIIVH